LLWLWHRPAATAPIRPLAWEPPCAAGAALEKTKRQKKKKKKETNYFHIPYVIFFFFFFYGFLAVQKLVSLLGPIGFVISIALVD